MPEPASQTDLEATVRMLADRQAIRDCLANYCRAVDRLDRELLLSVYHPDAFEDHGVFVGDREGFADWVIAFHSRAQHTTQHVITNHTCELDGDVAHTETYYMFAAMNVEGSPLTLSGGRYIDRFEKRDGRWGIAHRVCLNEIVGQFVKTELPEQWAQALASTGPVARDKRDISYQRPLTDGKIP